MNNPHLAAAQTPSRRPFYPFSAIVGQERMKLALLLNAVDPAIGGVLIRGEKGTAKSTAARALAQILPEISIHRGCAFACSPERPDEWCPSCRNAADRGVTDSRRARLITLPLNATEDMVAGGLDFSATMASRKRAFQPGLLAKAHRGILYIDEVNLLDDHLVDIILDAAESGVNIVEREGMSFRHGARFALVASMNPEEGGLRPQLLDRFGLCVEVVSEEDPILRVRLMERREAFEADPTGFCDAFAAKESALAGNILKARNLLPAVRLAPYLQKYITELALSRNVAGHRADLVIGRAALAHAALAGRETVKAEDVLEVAELVLIHRARDSSPPPPPPPPPEEDTEKPQDKSPPAEKPKNDENNNTPPPATDTTPNPPEAGDKETDKDEAGGSQGEDTHFDIGNTFKPKRLAPTEDRLARRGSGRRTRTRTEDKQGRYVRSRYREDCRDLAVDATLRAAAPYQVSRRTATANNRVVIYRRDWREKVREKRIGTFILFVVDASGSMGARGRMVASKGAVMSLLLDAYQKRDRLAMIIFRRREAELLLPPTSSVEVAGKLLREMPVGGRTPLSSALVKAHETLMPQLRREPNLRPMVILVTDGKANVGLDEKNRPVDEALRLAEHIGNDDRIQWIIVDTEDRQGVRFGLAQRIAAALGGAYYSIDDLKASHLVDVVKGL